MYEQPQLPLDTLDGEQVRLHDGPSLDERFEMFHAAHPWVFEALEELTAQWVAAGGGQIGIKALFEQLSLVTAAHLERRALQAEQQLHLALRAPTVRATPGVGRHVPAAQPAHERQRATAHT
ncbi:hypothetical protein ACH40E_39630 [Streptomyces acidicola]|uniref:hypothetical protein n=1 Tax=Streptomyces acidicola TaxID=2596892 RepID=UPI00378FCFC9